jgi:hypothetical protein
LLKFFIKIFDSQGMRWRGSGLLMHLH